MVVVQRVVEGVRTIHRLQKGQVLADGLLVNCGAVGTSSTLGSPWLAGGDVLKRDCSVLTCLVLQFPLVQSLYSMDVAKAVVTCFPHHILDLRLKHLTLALL